MYKKFHYIISTLLGYFTLFIAIPFRKKGIITCAGKTDGMGAQVQAVYSAILYAHLHKITYCHTPLKSVEHNYHNNKNYNQQIEDFFALSLNESKIEAYKKSHKIVVLDNISLSGILLVLLYFLGLKNNIIFQKSHFHNYINRFPDKYLEIKEKLRSKFFHNKTIPVSNPILKIVVHIRRGDVLAIDKERYTANETIIALINDIKNSLDALQKKYEITIFSQGNANDFEIFKEVAIIHLNQNVFEDYLHFVNADILLTAKSALSYSAAILSNAFIIYEPFYHQPLSDWFIYNDAASVELLKNKLTERFSA